MRQQSDSRPRWRAIVAVLLATIVAAGSGCDDGNTRVAVTAPVAPLGFSISRDSEGDWTIGVGAITRFGGFAIEHTFATDAGYTYIVIRDRERGKDQVFRMASDGWVEAHAVGDHRIRFSREGKRKWIFDVQTKEGTIDFRVYPSGKELARVVFSSKEPTFTVWADNRLTIKEPHWLGLGDKQNISLDSVERVEWRRSLLAGPNQLRIKWKDGIAEKPLSIQLARSEKCEGDFAILRGAISQASPRVQFAETAGHLPSGLAAFLLLLTFVAGCMGAASAFGGGTLEERRYTALAAAGLLALALFSLYMNGAAMSVAAQVSACLVGLPLAVVGGARQAKSWATQPGE